MLKQFTSILIICLSFITISFANEKIPDVTVSVTAQMFESNSESYLVLNYDNAPHWHTYWKNPGDAGLPIKFLFFTESTPIKLEQLEWPTPQRFFEAGNMLAYGYVDSKSFFFKLDPLAVKETIRIKSEWLVCKHLCIPGKVEFSGKKTNGKIVFSRAGSLSNSELAKRFAELPRKSTFPKNLDIVMHKSKEENKLVLFYNLSNSSVESLIPDANILTPFPDQLLSFYRENLYKDKKGNTFAKMLIDWEGEFSEPPLDLPADGKFKQPIIIKFLYSDPVSKVTKIIEKSFPSFSVNSASKMGEFFTLLKPVTNQKGHTVAKEDIASSTPTSDNPSSAKTFLLYLVFAFIGGLILNIMPCVLPVISIKLFGLLKQSHESKNLIFKHNISYSLGVLFSFFILASTVALLKGSGEFVGWGFHLQSPRFVAIMVLVIFVFALNLFGLFEIRTPGANTLVNVNVKEGFAGDFFGGILATVLSTPCSAPFLGTALTFAFTESTTTLYIILMTVGLGLTSPFLLTAFFPKLISFLPRPGAWMEHFKKFLGLSLILTMVWLFDVYTTLDTSSMSMLKLNLTLTFAFFAFYARKSIFKNKFLVAIFFLIPIYIFTTLIMTKPAVEPDTQSTSSIKLYDLNWDKWSHEKMQEHKENQELVFMDFTAKWCFTCKVTEKLVINTDKFRKLVKDHNIKLLLGDWTKRDPIIGNFLKSQGLIGVPAYFIQKKDGTLINLGETLTVNKIKSHL